jgi:hypothetical protein
MIKDFIEQFVFFPNKELKKTPSNIDIIYEDVFLNLNNNNIHGWFIKSTEKIINTKDKVILFFHGNAGNISYRLYYIKKFYDLGFSMLFFDYPGFGLSIGTPNENVCIEAGHLFYNFLLKKKKFQQENIIFYGESIGGSISCSLALKVNIKYLIMQSTFTDIKEIIKNVLSFNVFVIDNIGFETLNNLKIRHKLNIINKKMKTLVIHSYDDELIDINYAKKFEPFCDKLYLCKGTHSNIEIDNDFIYNLITFLK